MCVKIEEQEEGDSHSFRTASDDENEVTEGNGVSFAHHDLYGSDK